MYLETKLPSVDVSNGVTTGSNYKAFRWLKGTQMFRKSALDATYKTVWCAGPSLDGVHSIRHVSQVVADLLIPFMSEGDN